MSRALAYVIISIALELTCTICTYICVRVHVVSGREKATVRGCFFAAASRRSKLACTSPSQSYNKFTRIVSAPFIGNLGMEHT